MDVITQVFMLDKHANMLDKQHEILPTMWYLFLGGGEGRREGEAGRGRQRGRQGGIEAGRQGGIEAGREGGREGS